ncbi:MAG: TonB-dependent receptor [Acidobacteria bacterium]|nr:MAG: TonB-dependent receptor [Acidobacteriota bacterium]
MNKNIKWAVLNYVATLVGLVAFSGLLAARPSPRPQSANQRYQVEGVVKDPSGAVLMGAQVTLRAADYEATQTTGPDGHFIFFQVPSSRGTVSVSATGFAPFEAQWKAGTDETVILKATLHPAAAVEQITVTATRMQTPLNQATPDVRVLTQREVAATPALTLDSVLQQVPGFTLFRRTGSRVANPTAQGVSLRGVGASGASRALVLEDGIPLNDPFGGWVYWDRVPREAVGRLEVVRGGVSDLYGSPAMGGVINILTRKATTSEFSLDTSYGNENTPDGSFWSTIRHGPWAMDFDGEAFNTDGYVLVNQQDRGAVDTPANSEHEVGDATLERKLGENGRVFATATYFREIRANGTPLTYNRTHTRQLAVGADWVSERAGAFSFRGYGGPEVFDQTFSSVVGDRSSETLIRSQRVPAQQTGIGIQWYRPVGTKQTLAAGFDGREVRGASNELGFTAGRMTSAVGAGGRQRTTGVYGEDVIRLTARWQVTAALRFDHWRNYDALSTSKSLTSARPATVTNFPERTESAISPRLGMLYRLTGNISLVGSAYRAFRAPTLNELYRGFRVGNVVTNANSNLKAERLTGAEAGAQFDAFRRKLTGRGTFFWSDLTDPIANVTLNVTPRLITRQRQNLGRTRSRGVDLDATLHVTPTFELSSGYEFVYATIQSFAANPSLVGLKIPQVPSQVFTFQTLYSNPTASSQWKRVTLGLQGRYVGNQFDDDQNLLPLGNFFTLDASLSRRIWRDTEAYVAVENIFDERYAVQRTPVPQLGYPVLFRVGFRMSFGNR